MTYPCYNRNRKATVLIAVVGILAVLSLLAATFGIMMRVEMAASGNQTEYELARQAAHAGCEYLITSLKGYLAGRPFTSGALPSFSPNPDDLFGCQLILKRNGLNTHFALCEHTQDIPWMWGLGNKESGSFNLNAHGFAADLGSASNFGIRYTSFDTSLVRLLAARFDFAATDPDMSTDDKNKLDAGFANFRTDPDERRRVAILINKAIMDWRHGTNKVPGDPYVESRRLGHIPRWSGTVMCSDPDAGVQYPADTDDKDEWGYNDNLPSLLINRTNNLGDQWCYAEPGIWQTNLGGPDWAHDVGVAGSGAFWGKVAQVTGAGTYTIEVDRDAVFWRDWATDRWLSPTNAYLYVGTGLGRGWYYQIATNGTDTLTLLATDGVAFSTGTAPGADWANNASRIPEEGDVFCILTDITGSGTPDVSILGGNLDRRWDNATAGHGDLVPTAVYWPDGSLAPEPGVADLVYDIRRGQTIGTVTAADNTNLPGTPHPYLEDSTKSWNTTYAANELVDKVVYICAGTGRGQARRIIAGYTATHLDLETDWEIIPGAGSRYRIEYYNPNRPSKYQPDNLQGDDRTYLSLGALRDSVIVPAFVNEPMALGTAQDVADVLIPYFQDYLTVSNRGFQVKQELACINDWGTDQIDNNGDGVTDDDERAYELPSSSPHPNREDLAKELYERLGLKDWAHVDPGTRVKHAAQLVAIIIDFRDEDDVPTEITQAILGETVAFTTVRGYEGVQITEVMASPPEATLNGDGTELTHDGVGAVATVNPAPPPPFMELFDGQGWDWNTVTNDRWFLATAPASPGQWTFSNLIEGWYAIRIHGSPNTFYSFNGVNNNVQTDGSGWGYARMQSGPSGKLMAVQVDAAKNLSFTLQCGTAGSEFYTFELLPQYVEITNCAAHDVFLRSVAIGANTLTLPANDKINGASADGVFPVNYGFYVVAMSEEAYERQWGVNSSGVWGDVAGEDYPVYFAGDPVLVDSGTASGGALRQLDDATKNWTPGSLVGQYLILTASAQARQISANTATQITVVGPDFAPAPGPGTAYEVAPSPDPDTSADMLLIPLTPGDITVRALQPDGSTEVVAQAAAAQVGTCTAYTAREKPDTPFSTTATWNDFGGGPPAPLEGSQNVQVNLAADLPRSAGASFRSCLNGQYSVIWTTAPGSYPPAGTLKKASDLVTNSQVYPIIRNRPYPTVGWLGLVPTGHLPWRTVDPDPSPENPPDNTEQLLGTLMANATVGGIHARFNINTAPAEILAAVFEDGAAAELALADEGTATAPFNNTTLSDSSKSWTAGRWAGYYVSIVQGTGQGQTLEITGNSGTQLNLNGTWDTTPDATSEYVISRRSLNGWANWDALLNDDFFTLTANDANRTNRLGFYDDISGGIANEDSGAGQIMDDFKDDSDEKEEWARRYANLFDLRSTAFRFVVAGLVYVDDRIAGTAAENTAATGGSVNSLTLTGADWDANAFMGSLLRISSFTPPEVRLIKGNTTDTITVSRDFSAAVAVGDEYEIIAPPVAHVRIEVDVDMGTDADGDGNADVRIVHMRYLSGQ